MCYDIVIRKQTEEYAVTLKALAQAAGVSVATVSKAFSGSREISEETKERIFELARREGCFDKYNKNKFHKRVIAVICPELISEYYTDIIAKLTREAETYGALVTVSATDFDKAREQELFAYYSSYCNADGIIVVGNASRIKNVGLVPAVSLDGVCGSEGVSSVCCRLQAAICDAVRYLKGLGHTRIGFAGEALTESKLHMFKNAMRSAGLPLEQRYTVNSSERFERAGADTAEGWLREGEPPTAVIAAYDYIAIGIIKTFREAGYRVPEDISVIGMDDIKLDEYLETSLSSVHVPKEELCHEAVRIIMKKLDNQHFSPRTSLLIPAELIIRASTAPVKSGDENF